MLVLGWMVVVILAGVIYYLIKKNESNMAKLSKVIAINRAQIEENKGNISSNKSDITKNKTGITRNKKTLDLNQDALARLKD